MERRVHFSKEPPKYRYMHTWLYAHREARRGTSAQDYADRIRFEKRIQLIDSHIGYIFREQHRKRIICYIKHNNTTNI